MKVAVEKRTTVRLELTGEQAGWLAAISGGIAGGSDAHPAARFFSELYQDLLEAEIDIPMAKSMVVVRDGKMWWATAHDAPEQSGTEGER